MPTTLKLFHALIVAAGGDIPSRGAPPVIGVPADLRDTVPLDALLPSFRDACLLLASVVAIAAAMVVFSAAGAA